MSKYEEKNMKNNENIKKDINFKKSLGQNFLFDKNLLRAISRDGMVSRDDVVLEIGAGAGTLTAILAEEAKKVVSFEIDKELISRLEKVQEEHPNIEFHFQDFMDVSLDQLDISNARVVANIPYYITTPIIFKLIDRIDMFKSILVLIQKEVAERFAASANNKDYGITSVILQSIFDVSIPRVVKKENFTPAPKIDSALCLLVPHDKYKIKDFDKFKDLVHSSFAMRRKTLVNNLTKVGYDKDTVLFALETLGYSTMVRPENIDVSHYIELHKILNYR